MTVRDFAWIFGLALSCFMMARPASAAEDKFSERPLDGVSIEALETYQNPKNNQLDFGLGVWPLNPYFNGYSVDVGYNMVFNRTWTWEMVRASYIYTVDTGLFSELADKYQLNPQFKIERPDFIFSSDFKYVFAYGKSIFYNKYIRYFRSQVIAGPAYVHTNKGQEFGADLGLGVEAYVNESFSWKFEIRDYLASVGSSDNNLIFSVGTGYAF